MTRRKSDKNELINEVHDCGIDYEGRELFVGTIDGITCDIATEFIKNLRLLDKQEKTNNIIIHFNTCGGEWEYGMAMYDAIKACSSSTVALCYANARSMSSIIPQAAKYRIIMPNAYFMIHEGTLAVDSTSKSASTFVKFNDKLNEDMLLIYLARCRCGQLFQKMSDIKIKKFIKDKIDKFEEWYLTSQESVEYGFMDAVLGSNGYETIKQLKQLI